MRLVWFLWWAIAAVAVAEVRSGHAVAALVAGSDGYTGGKPVELGIRLRMDEGWHTYWINPGEGGMPLSAEWDLPEGWVAGPLLHPVPNRFMTGELAGYGYEGEVVIPVFLTPPAGADGSADIKVSLSWLTCDDSACVPGDAELGIELAHGVSGPGRGVAAIAAALKRVPQPLAGADLRVAVSDAQVVLDVGLPVGVDPTGCEVFAATPTVLDSGQRLRLTEAGNRWQATAAANEYADGPPTKLDLVLTGGKLEKPVLLRWESEP